MESDNSNFFKTNLLEQDATLAAFRKRNKKLILVFKFFFISLALIIGSLFIYLVQDNTSESDHSTPIISSESQIFTLSLQNAAEGLEHATSLILSNYSASNIDINTKFVLKNCRKLLRNGSGQIRDPLEVMHLNPFLGMPRDEQKVAMMHQIIAAEENIESCLDDLRKVESTAACEVRLKVLQAKFCLDSRGDFLMSHDEKAAWHTLWSHLLAAAWALVYQNLFTVCMCVLQLLFVFYMFWTVLFKFR